MGATRCPLPLKVYIQPTIRPISPIRSIWDSLAEHSFAFSLAFCH
jgi:hypothetical protein